ncbi:AEC family transporter [Streptomyces morookaense]|uniref:AEC family transporter n=1 Tax=Streptomyces morookaense TaxID=1970 RepID=A0A7Y7B9V5_STRMO|nr:AEC family transporter [Streptomyces morookaense]NVK81634.1 AEC family transporter [Streptomyces morookaense]
MQLWAVDHGRRANGRGVVQSVISGFIPIWAVTAAGWGAGRTGVLGPRAQPVLARFAFTCAMPALLFLTLSQAPLHKVADPGVAVFALSLLLVFAAALLLCRLLWPMRPADRAVNAMAASYVNSANLGIPVALGVLGDTSFIAAAAVFQMLVVTPLIMVIIELDAHRSAPGRRRRLLQLPLRNPVIGSAAAGVAVSAAGWRLPGVVVQPLHMIGGAGVPTALFALGMSLNTRLVPDIKGLAERLVLVALKVAVQPAAAYALGRWAFGLDRHALLAVTLCAGLPTAQNAFVYAAEYRLRTDVARDAVVWSTLLSFGTLSLITWLLA